MCLNYVSDLGQPGGRAAPLYLLNAPPENPEKWNILGPRVQLDLLKGCAPE